MDALDVAPTLRVEARFKNARLYNAIAAASPLLKDNLQTRVQHSRGPVLAFCRLHGLPQGSVYDLLNLRMPKGVARKRRMPSLCERLAVILEREIGYLFPPDLYQITWPRLVAEVSHNRFVALTAARGMAVLELPPSQDDGVLQREIREAIGGALSTLKPREERVLTMRYGLGGGAEATHGDVGRAFGITAESARQIEAKALRKLRHPRYSRPLRKCL